MDSTMTSMRMANDENAPVEKTVHVASPNNPKRDSSQFRRVLGDVSPNVKAGAVSAPTRVVHKQDKGHAAAGSPLKRSFTATLDDEAGFTYLKKRRLSSSTVPTSPNTPSDGGDAASHSPAEGGSFSSLINYDNSSQQTSRLLLQNPPTRAETLRLRLRIAMYKVRTNQIHVPFAELQIEGGAEAEGADEGSKVPSQAVEEAVSVLRQEARQVAIAAAASAAVDGEAERSAFPKLLGVPLLRPTAYSSRMIYDPAPPTSPPGTASDEHSQSTATPRQANKQTSSLLASPERLSNCDDTHLTSSVIEGRVAEGLLGLRDGL